MTPRGKPTTVSCGLSVSDVAVVKRYSSAVCFLSSVGMAARDVVPGDTLVVLWIDSDEYPAYGQEKVFSFNIEVFSSALQKVVYLSFMSTNNFVENNLDIVYSSSHAEDTC